MGDFVSLLNCIANCWADCIATLDHFQRASHQFNRWEELNVFARVILDPVKYETLLNELLKMKLESEIEIRVTCGPQFARVCRQVKLKQLTNSVNGCMGGKSFGFISYRGDVQTCGFLDISAGNLIENDFDFGKIWLASEFLEQIRNLSEYKGSCAVCEYVATCGGCRARAYAMSGDYLATDPVCNYRRGNKD